MRNQSVLCLCFSLLLTAGGWKASPADTTAPTVTSLIPPAGSAVVELRSVEVFFDEPVTGVDAGDLLINGLPAVDVAAVLPSQYRFTFSQPSTGTVSVAWAPGHGITDQAVPPNAFAGGNWSYSLDPGLALNAVRINEFLADNQTGIRDEDGTYQDWIELYNGSTIGVNLEGCFLTDTKLKLDNWRFPTVFMAPNSYLLVWASNKNRTNNPSALHTNFRLDSGGEYLALVGPNTNVISSFDPEYPPQRSDVSYGRDPQTPSITGYYSRPTPSGMNVATSSGSGSDFAPDVIFSQNSSTFVAPFNLVLSTTSTNAAIRYVVITNAAGASATSTNVPTTNSTLYTGPIPIQQTTQIRARTFEPGKLPGTPVSTTYILISPNVLGFSSDLPLVLITTFGATLSQSGDGTGYAMLFDNKLDRTSLSNVPTLSSRVAVNDRGSSTANQPKNNIALEFWDEFNQDTDRPFFDMPPESDFVLYGINGFDPSLMHNAIFHWFGRNVGRYSSRTRYVEMFRKSDAGAVTTNDYVGLYLVEEKPKRNKNRVAIETLQPENTNAPAVTGGYLLKIDRTDPDEVSIPFVAINGVAAPPAAITFASPNLSPSIANDPRRVVQRNYIQNYLYTFVTNLTTPDWTNPVTGYKRFVDVDAWVDNLVVNLICFNVDGYRLSGYFFKDRDKKLEQGPPWDCDRCLGTGGAGNTPQGDNRPFNPRIWRTYTTDVNSDQGTDFFGRSSVGVSWFNRVFRDPDFWQAFIDRYQQTRTNIFSNERVLAMVDGFYQEIKEAQTREEARWAPPPVGRTAFTWSRSGRQSVSTAAGAFTNAYTFDFGPTNPLSGATKVGFYTNEVNFQKQWLMDRLDFIDTNFLAMPTLTLAPGSVTNATPITVKVAAKPGSQIYYTLDGTDPRLLGGAISPAALSVSGDLHFTISDSIRLFARSYNLNHANLTNSTLVGNPPINSFWSGPIAASYYTSIPPLRITEIMYHPAPPPAGNTNDDDNFEYVEVKNTGATPLNVNRFRLGGGVTFDFPNAILAAGQSAVIVKNPAAFQSRYPAGPLVLGAYTGNLANNGDHLVLEGGFREPILDFKYSDSWYPITDGNGFSLQIVDEHAATDTWGLKASWRPSGTVNGTPGADDPGAPAIPVIYVNEALTHTDPAPSDAIELFNPGSAANVGGWYLSDSFGTPKKFRIPNGTVIAANGYLVFYQSNSFGIGAASFALGSKGDSVYLFSADAAGNLTGYFHGFDFGAQANGVTFGRHVLSTGEEAFPTQTTPTLGGPNSGPLVGPVVISEINYHPVDFLFPKTTVDNSIDEYIELQNFSASPAPLYDPLHPSNTWKLRDAVGFIFPPGVTIPPGGFILVVSFVPTNGPALDSFRAAVGVSPSVPIYGPWSGKLDNSEDNVELARPDLPDPPGTSTAGLVGYILVDKVHYHTAAPWPTGSADGLGASIQRVSPTGYGNDPANWRAALKTPGTGLPGGATPPSITQQPSDTTGNETYSASFTVNATGSQPIGYQWLFNGQPIRGGIGATLTLTGLRLTQTGTYSCLVLNAAGSTLSSNAHLTVRQVAVISQHPADVRLRGSTNTADYGFTTNNATFSVIATGTGALHYQWRYNGANIAGATAATLVVPDVGLTNEGLYDVAITDDVAPVFSLPARLIDLITPVYVVVPQNQVVVTNGTFTASAVIRGNPPPYRFEWRETSTVRAANTVPDTTNFFTSAPITTGPFTNKTTLWRLLIFSDSAPVQGVLTSFNVISALDTDGDGIPDDWETAYGLDPNTADSALDSDGDGMSNLQEYLAGTDPTNRASNLRIDLTTLPNGAMVKVGVAAGHTYTVQYSDALPGNWSRLADLIARSTNRVEQIADPGYTDKRFYRLVAPRQ